MIEELSNGIEADSLEDPEFTVPTRSFSHQAPESLLGQVTLKSDVWSFGAILYHMFTGKPIYEGKDSEDILWAMKKEKANSKIEAIKKTENCNPTEFDLFQDLLQSCLIEDQEPISIRPLSALS